MKLTTVLAVLSVFLLSGCAGTSWQVKTTGSYLAGGAAIKIVEPTFHPPCDAGTLPVDKCDQLKKVYNDTRTAYISAGTVLKLCLLSVGQSQDDLLLQFPIIYEEFIRLSQELITIIQNMEAKATKTQMPQLKREISPGLIEAIISGLLAVIKALPDIIEIVNVFQLSEVEIENLCAKITKVQESLPVWE